MRRRSFLVAGMAGATLLAAAGWWAASRRSPTAALAPDSAIIVRAIVPAMLAGALPSASGARAKAIDETVVNVARAIGGLPPASRAELERLFALLSLAPARRAFANVASPWQEAGEAEVTAFLDAWRDSGWALKRSAYDALHQLVIAAWYGNEASWARIGYPGPPAIGA
jgi:hypothetical protein